MKQRIVNKKLKKTPELILWMYHLMSDGHIQGHNWLHQLQYNAIQKLAGKIKFKQIRKSKYYDDKQRIMLCGLFIECNRDC